MLIYIIYVAQCRNFGGYFLMLFRYSNIATYSEFLETTELLLFPNVSFWSF